MKINSLLLAVAALALGVALGYSTGYKENLDIIQQCEALLPRDMDCVLAAIPTPTEPLLPDSISVDTLVPGE